MKKRILVTGGAGFIGSHLCKRLLAENNRVICLDNFFTGNKTNISPFLSNPDFQLIEHDITVPFEVEVDEIYNLACPASPIHYQYDPVKTIKASVLGANNVLELAQRTKAKVLQASTSEVYATPSYIRNRKIIGVMSIPSASAHAMTKEKDVRRPYLWIFTDITA